MAKTKKAKTRSVPQDEIQLAAALAAANARNLAWCSGTDFKDDYGYTTNCKRAAMCCARGALRMAGLPVHQPKYSNVTYGNDWNESWSGFDAGDDGESLGWAFRQAMQEGE